MKFSISRTSGGDPPCGEAVKEHYQMMQHRLVAWLEEHPRQHKNWQQHGSDHQVKNGIATRMIPWERWVVEIESLEDLLAHIDKWESETIVYGKKSDGLPSIEIYDDYRE